MAKNFTIGKTKVGDDYPCFITAEVGINLYTPEDKHPEEGLERGLEMIEAAAKAGANGVKFQMFTAERMYPKGAGLYTIASGKKVDIWKVIKENELVAEWVTKLRKRANELGLESFVTTCDEDSSDILARRGVPAFKIASGELTYLPLLRHTARKKKPMIISTGGARLTEVAEAVEAIKKEGNNDIAIMHCVLQYPAKLNTLNLAAIKTLKMVFPEAVIGWSDHSVNPTIAPAAAVALGAKIVEKHFTLSKDLPGPDHSFAIEPDELKAMVEAIRTTEKRLAYGKKIDIDQKLLGTSERIVYPEEVSYRQFLYRTIFATQAIKKGERFTPKNIMILRPGEFSRGLEPKYYNVVLTHKATRNIKANAVITWDDVLS